jgi:hypothetical protein
MTNGRPKVLRETDKLSELQKNARARYVYFICKEPSEPGYWWELVGPDDMVICESREYATKAECLKSLRATQRHASTTQIRDDAR